MKYNSRGEEIPDTTPIKLPISFTRPKTLSERMKELLRSEELRRALDAHDVETFAEADDFDTGDDDPLKQSPYETNFDPDHTFTREQEIRQGIVEDIPLEKKHKSRETVKRHYGRKRRQMDIEDYASAEASAAAAAAPEKQDGPKGPTVRSTR